MPCSIDDAKLIAKANYDAIKSGKRLFSLDQLRTRNCIRRWLRKYMVPEAQIPTTGNFYDVNWAAINEIFNGPLPLDIELPPGNGPIIV